MIATLFISGLLGMGIGMALGCLWKVFAQKNWQHSMKLLEADLYQSKGEFQALTQTHAILRENFARLEAKKMAQEEAQAEKIAFIQSTEEKLLNSFKATAAEALKASHTTFSQFAEVHFESWHTKADNTFNTKTQAIEGIIHPLKEALGNVDQRIHQLEKAREGAYHSLTEQVRSLLDHQFRLEHETRKLAHALRTPHVRGQWGEIQLKRLVEVAGMLEHVDFTEQSSIGEQKRLRPDMIVFMPNGRSIAIDSKVPLDAYLQAMDSPDDASKKIALAKHARHVRERISELGQKNYWKDLPSSPEFVVLFLPAETLLSAAFAEDPTLLEWSSNLGVIPVTPVSLLALLKTVAYGWRQETMAQEAKNISLLGKELYDRIAVLMEHWDDLRKNLSKTCESYNKAVNSLETRIVPTARKLESYQASTQRTLQLPQPLQPCLVETTL
jgi:DNA recombination protein RmuC